MDWAEWIIHALNRGCYEWKFDIKSNNINRQTERMQDNAEPSFLNCYICFEGLKKPRMCPGCSKVACQRCLRQWIEERRSECPHCRKIMPLNNFAECERFISDVRHLLKAIDKNEKVKQKCAEHKIQMTYYCQECQEPICSDCGMFGSKHRGHSITHLKKIYQGYKNKILNELARFDQKIQAFHKNGYQIKLQMQKLVVQIGNKKNFIEEYFLAIIERLQEQFKEKQQKVTEKYDANTKEIEFLESFRENICRELESSTEKELITKSDELIGYIQSIYDKGADYQPEEHNFDTIHEIVPKYNQFHYVLKNFEQLGEGIVYSDPYISNGIEWRMKIYPRGNGAAKETHLSVFLEMTTAFVNGNKYEYKIELIHQKNVKDSVVREYNSNFDIGQCWGYNQFIPLEELKNDFLSEQGHLEFNVSVRNPSYRSLVRDQKQYIRRLEETIKSQPPVASARKEHQAPKNMRNPKMNELAEQSKKTRENIKKFLMEERPNNQSFLNEQLEQMEMQEKLPELRRIRSDQRRQAGSNSNNLSLLEQSLIHRANLSVISNVDRQDEDDEFSQFLAMAQSRHVNNGNNYDLE